MKTLLHTTGAAALLLTATPAIAATRELVVEGHLTDAAGGSVPDSSYAASVKLCTAPSGGACPWDDTLQSNVVTSAGYFQVRLGSNPDKPLTDALFAAGAELWFELKLGTQVFPRTPLASVPYAFRAYTAADASTVGGYSAASTPTAGKLLVLDAAGRVPAGALPTPTNLQCSGCVDGSDLAAGAVAFTHLSGAGCAASQVITWTGTAFACLDTAKVYTAGTGIQLTNLNAITLDKAKVEEYAKGVCYDTPAELSAAAAGWDQVEGDDVVAGDVAGGDLTGVYPAPSLKDGAVSTSKLADAAVTNAKLAAEVEARLAALEARAVPVGTIIPSILSEAQFAQVVPQGQQWVLADGKSWGGTALAALTGKADVPDLRGKFLRGFNAGIANAAANGNPDNTALGVVQTDEYKGHTHGISLGDGGSSVHTYFNNTNSFHAGASIYSDSGGAYTINSPVSTAGGNETRPRNVTVNFFIRIN